MKIMLLTLVFSGLVLLGGSIAPENKSECLLRVAKEKAQRDLQCPPGGEYTDVARAQCLQSSQKQYESDKKSCPTE